MLNKKKIYAYLLIIITLFLFSCSRESARPIEGMVYIPSGEFIMGSEDVDTEGFGKEFGLRRGKLYEDERPMRKITLKGYYIDKYEVTNMEYKAFISATLIPPPPAWKNGMYPSGQAKYPVTNVTWFDAHGYCSWAGKRLPTEEEWEKAARGPDGNKYPWGNEYDEKKGNLKGGTAAPAGSYESDKSYYGVYDMGGNVIEWVDAYYEPYPGNKLENKDFGKKSKVLRGGSGFTLGHYILNKIFARSSFRYHDIPNGGGNDTGFRCATDVKSNKER